MDEPLGCFRGDAELGIPPLGGNLAAPLVRARLYEGHGTLTLEGRAIPVREVSTCLVGRYVRHRLDNEAAGTMKVLVVAFPPGIEEGWRAIGEPRRWGEAPPPRYGRGEIPNLVQILDDAGFSSPERIDATPPAGKGSACA